MKNIKTLIGMLIFVLTLFIMMQNNVSKAVSISVRCTKCGETGQATYTDNGTSDHSTHKIEFKCPKCSYNIVTEGKHYVASYVQKGNYHDSICLCGRVVYANREHNYLWIPIDSNKCKGICKDCKYEVEQEHNFVDNVCTRCGVKLIKVNEYASDDRDSQYFVVRNTENSDLKVNFVVKGISNSANTSYRQLEFSDVVPANSTRIYTKSFMQTSAGDFISVNYYQVGGTSGALAFIGSYNNKSNNFEMGKNAYVTVLLPTDAPSSTRKWEDASGLTTSFYINNTGATTYGYTAVDGSNRDWFYKGIRGDLNVDTGVKASVGTGNLPNGQVLISYNDEHIHVYETTYEINNATHTAVNKCTKCGDTYKENVENHSWNENHKCKICEYQGTHSGGATNCATGAKCEGCGTEYTSALGHIEGEIESCTGPVRCSRCNEVLKEVAGHDYGDYTNGGPGENGIQGHYRECKRCKERTATEAHKYSSEPVLTKTNPRLTHCYLCEVCGYEGNVKTHTMVGVPIEGTSEPYYHRVECSVCKKFATEKEECTFTSKVTREATCQVPGIEQYTCLICNRHYDKEIETDHKYSSDVWQKDINGHWKLCDYGCGTKSTLEAHIDTSPKDGHCDVCNYVVAVEPVVEISSDQAVREGEKAEFFVRIIKGTQPMNFQWYYRDTRDSTSSRYVVEGETNQRLTLETTREMNGRYYFCEVWNNENGPKVETDASLLTVYYPHILEEELDDVEVKGGEEAVFEARIKVDGNPNKYTYQWYYARPQQAGEELPHGSRINGANEAIYKFIPQKNIKEEYYYCVVSNGEYEVTTKRARLTADVTSPTIAFGTFEDGGKKNSKDTIKIQFVVTDTGEGFKQDSFTADDIKLFVGNEEITSATKNLKYINNEGDNYIYELELSNLANCNGILSFVIQANSIEDNFGNTNSEKKLVTRIEIDNTLPLITYRKVQEYVDGKWVDKADKWVNKADRLKICFSIKDVNELDLSKLNESGIAVLVGDSENTDVKKSKVEYNKTEDYYELTLENITKNGKLKIKIAKDSIIDSAKNGNLETEFDVTSTAKEVLTVDNEAPKVTVKATLDSYESSDVYPGAVSDRSGWSNRDIYIQLVVDDGEGEVETYKKSVGDNLNFEDLKLSTGEITNKECISESIQSTIYYRVYDKAGNYSESNIEIKLDKITPNAPAIYLYENRKGGAIYKYNNGFSTENNILVMPNSATIVDTGNVQSGINLNSEHTYFTIAQYADTSKSGEISGKADHKYQYNESVFLQEDGYYEIQMFMEDIAGNKVQSEVYKLIINKKAENTIRVYNLNDIGSGVQSVTIKIHNGSRDGAEVIDPIIVENPYNEVIKNVKLPVGTFYVQVIIKDKVGNETELYTTIENKF